MILNLRRALPQLQMRIAIFRKDNNGHAALQKAMIDLGVEVSLLDDQALRPDRAIRQIRNLVTDHDINIVHAHGYKGNVLATIALRKIRSTALICMEHGFTDKSIKSTVYGMVDRMALRARSVTRVVCVSETVTNRCLAAGAPAHKIVNITNSAPPVAGVPTDFSERDIDLLFLGRLSIEKGADVLIEALSLLEKKPGRVVIAGDSPDRPNLERQAKSSSAADLIEFTGYCSDPASLFRRAKWLVLPSRTEGAPMTLLEAFACGAPAIASNVGAVGALFDRAQFGRLVEAGDPALLADAIDSAMALEVESWRAFSQNAISLTKGDYSFEKWAERWLSFYTELTRGEGAL